MSAAREEVARLLPEGAFLRVDRSGSALFVTRPGTDVSRLERAGWRCEPAGGVIRVSPGLPQLDALRAVPTECRLVGAERFSARPSDPDVLPLLAATLRALELPLPEPAKALLEKRVRQQMALCLRVGGGGGLEVCARIIESL